MKHLIYRTNDPEPENEDTSTHAKLYRKYDLKNAFESYIAWGPNYLELHCHTTPARRKLIVDSMYYLHYHNDEVVKKEKAPRDHVEMLCNVFDIPIKPRKKGK